MTACLKIGNRLLNGDEVISALIRYKLLETMAGQVLLDEAIEEIPLTKDDVFQALMGPTDATPPDDFENFLMQWCNHHDITPTYFTTVMLRELRVEKFKQSRFAAQVESEFMRLKPDLDQVEYSRIQLDDRALAQELYYQLRDDGADFAQLARQYTIAPAERESGGWVGPVPLSTLPPAIATLFRCRPSGVVHPPIVLADAQQRAAPPRIWLVRLEQLSAARLTPATRTSLLNRLHAQWLHMQVKSAIASSIAVQVDDAPEAAN